MLTFPVERGNILNLVAFASDRSKHEDERVWDGAWVKPVSMEQMLADFEDWDERPRRLLQVCSIVGFETQYLNLYSPAREGAASVGLARVPPAKLLDPRPDHAPRRRGKSQPISALHVGLPQTRRHTPACRTTALAPAKQLKMRTCSASCSVCPSARARRYRSFCLRTRPCAGPAHRSNRFIAAKPARYTMSACVPRIPSDGYHFRCTSSPAHWRTIGSSSPRTCQIATTGSGLTTCLRMSRRQRSSSGLRACLSPSRNRLMCETCALCQCTQVYMYD
jgi:hypothetical protein